MEGYLDVARALEAGVDEAVATCGTALTAGHARLLRRFTERVVRELRPGRRRARRRRARASTCCSRRACKVHVVELPDGHDPDTLPEGGGRATPTAQRLDEAPAYMEWLIRRAAAENDTRDAGRARPPT